MAFTKTSSGAGTNNQTMVQSNLLCLLGSGFTLIGDGTTVPPSRTYATASSSFSTAVAKIIYTVSNGASTTYAFGQSGLTFNLSGGVFLGWGQFGVHGSACPDTLFSLDTSKTGASTAGSGSSIAASTATLTPSADNELLISVMNAVRVSSTRTVSSVTIPSGFTTLFTGGSNTNWLQAAYWIQTTATATTSAWTVNMSGSISSNTWNWAVVTAAFKYTPQGWVFNRFVS